MKQTAKFIAVDLGASSGRVMAAHWDGRRFSMEEIHRFSNGGVSVGDHLHWDILHLWAQTQQGLAKYSGRYRASPDAIGVDAWGIDFGLLDDAGRLIGNPMHYRDTRTDGIPELLFANVAEQAVFAETGVQTWQINTLFQLYSMVLAKDAQLRQAATMLTIPDLFLYFLSGLKIAEYTEATTTQMYSHPQKGWARELLAKVDIPLRILPDVVQPGTLLGTIRQSVLRSCCFERDVSLVAVASHDTASAVAAIPNMDADSVFISSGTWSLMGAEVAEPNISEGARRLHFTNEGAANGAFLLLKNLTGLWIMQECLQYWTKRGIAHDWNGLVEAAAAASPLQAIFEPNDNRFNAQTNMPSAVQEYCRAAGQIIPETPGAIVRSLFESLALKYRSVLESLERFQAGIFRRYELLGVGRSIGCFAR